MRQRPMIFAIALVGIAAAPGAAAQYSVRPDISEQRVRCESIDGRERHCALDTRGGVRMVRQISRSACVEGQSWGVERGGIWVAQGCRAEFEVGRGGNRPGDRRHREQVVRCESSSGRSNVCEMDTRRGVELVRQLSRSACIREQSWGWNDRGVWVSGGCRAEFRSRAGGRDRDWNDGGPVQSVQSVRCESTDGRARHCPVDTRGGVRMVRQLSRTSCIEDRNWGYDRRGVWVEGGCRADFEAGKRDDQRWGGR
ncbi:MAG: DUF3011 domain-containing protein [Lysobacter sp.]